ncbi:MAG: antibiotic biosynthesis monooxygenase [Gammaproteobacteria bacterium]|nr:antibiotic biosynthesis monooxygenase [Gammaproteobacteria bacterium]
MYARLMSFKSIPENRSEIEAIADRASVLVRSMNGFVAAHFVISEDETTYGALSFWESKDDVDAAATQLREATMPLIQKVATEASTAMHYEVYEPMV